jgi:hypothetical protein
VPSEVLGGLDGDAPARAIIEEQDRLVAERSGTPALAVKSMHRSGSKKTDEAMRSSRYASASGLMMGHYFMVECDLTLPIESSPAPKQGGNVA